MSTSKKVVVIGGGAIGLSTAHYLHQAGHEVTVLEKGHYQDGASHGNAGMLVPSHIVPLAAPGVVSQGMRWLFRRDSPFRIKPRLDPGLAAWLWKFKSFCNEHHVEASMPLLRDLSLASVDLFADLASRLPFYFERRGLLMVHHTEKGEKENLKYAHLAEKTGLQTRILDTVSVKEVEPNIQTPFTGAVYYPQDAQLHPGQYIAAMRSYLVNAGIKCLEDAEVTEFSRQGDQIVALKTRGGEIVVDEVILAAGSWSPQIGRKLGIALPVQLAKGYSITIDHTPDHFDSNESQATLPKIPMILSEAKVTITPMGHQIRYGGTLELAGFDMSVDRKRASSILKTAGQYHPSLGPAAFETNKIWAGYRPCTPDGLPLLGRTRPVKNLIIATGHAMIGMTLAPITGKLVTQLVNQETPDISIDALNPERFNSGSAGPLKTHPPAYVSADAN